eukprot:1086503-Prymnesium_polylepis.1
MYARIWPYLAIIGPIRTRQVAHVPSLKHEGLCSETLVRALMYRFGVYGGARAAGRVVGAQAGRERPDGGGLAAARGAVHLDQTLLLGGAP